MPRPRSAFRTIAEPLAIAIALAFVVRVALRIYTIPSASMMPTLTAGDHILATSYLFGEPRRGDVVVFRSPANANEMLVKRVIAVPGDLIDAQLGRIRIGGHTLPEPYLLQPAAAGTFEAQIVAPDSYFVMGDNRAESYDSRHWGPLPRTRIVGRARLILWSSPAPGAAANAPATKGHRVFKCIR